jgi:serine protease Do
VNISTSQKMATGEPKIPEGLEIPEGTPFDDFFRHYFGEGEGGGEPSEVKSLGSGFILSQDGYVITNHHVVKGADEIIVRLRDRRELVAKVVGSDKRSDLALLKIAADNLPTVKLGSSDALKVGEWVLAIGSPFGFEHSVTAGIVSAKGRSLPSDNYVPFIQTDVAINPGNSGGPLINMRGEVVGINSQIYSRSGGSMGISFAIPIADAMRVSEQLRTSGRVIRGRIGVQIAPVTKEVAESIGLGKPAGALVQNAEAGGPADKAGIEAGDIITKVDGKLVEKSGDLPRLIGNTKPGTKTTLQVFRRGSTKDITVTVAEFEADKPIRRTSDSGTPPAPKGALGLSVADLNDAQKREMRLRGGVRVEAVDGAAARAGLREGDVILSMDNTEIADVKQFNQLAQKAEKAKAVSVLVRRGEAVNYLVIKPGR